MAAQSDSNGGACAYQPAEVERQAQQAWEAATSPAGQPDYTCLPLFVDAASKLHMGQCRSLVLCDAMARFERKRGRNVNLAFGWATHGLHTLLEAVDHDTAPGEWVAQRIAGGRQIVQRLGVSCDWQREETTSSPRHCRLTQSLFVRLWETADSPIKRDKQPGVAYWDPGTQSYISLRQLVNGRGPESGMLAEIRETQSYEIAIAQSMADNLLEDLDGLDSWDVRVCNMQRESIGREDGLTISFPLRGGGVIDRLEVFTSRPDTLMGTTFLAVATDHPLARQVAEQDSDVALFCQTVEQPDYAYLKMATEKSQEGIPLGVYAINPVNGDHLPVWVTNYVVAGYGTSAVLGIPAHDQRNFNFASRHNLPMRQVAVASQDSQANPVDKPLTSKLGVVVNSGPLEEPLNTCKDKLRGELGETGHTYQHKRRWDAAINECVLGLLHERGVDCHATAVARLRSWRISRPDFWGCPVPLIHCDACGTVTVPHDDLPVQLPEYVPGRDSLADYPEFVACKCPRCGKDAQRETDTLSEQFESSWHHLELASAAGKDADLDAVAAQAAAVNFYCCGIEHANNHLLSARIMHRLLARLGPDSGSDRSEPFASLLCPGLTHNYGLPMTKAYANAIEPTTVIDDCGADVLRLYLAAGTDPRQSLHWDETKLGMIQGVISGAELAELRAGKLAGASWDRARDLLSAKEIRCLQKGLLSRTELARLRAGTLDGKAYDAVAKLLGAGELERLQHGLLTENEFRQLRRSELDRRRLAKVREVVSEVEIYRLQRGLLEPAEFAQLCSGGLPAKRLDEAVRIAGSETIDRIRQLDLDIAQPGAVLKVQELLDAKEQRLWEQRQQDMQLLRKARGVLDSDDIRQLGKGSLGDAEQGELDKLLDADEQKRLGDILHDHSAFRPLLRFIDATRMDKLASHLDKHHMELLVGYLPTERMELLVGFGESIWQLVHQRLQMVAAGQGKSCQDPRRARLHELLQRITTHYCGEGPATTDLALDKVAARVRELVALIDEAANPDDGDDCALVAEAVPIMLHALSPLTPHLAEQLWAALGLPGLLAAQPWPQTDAKALAMRAAVTYVVQENGRKRLAFADSAELDDKQVVKRAQDYMLEYFQERGHPDYPETGTRIAATRLQRGAPSTVVNFIVEKAM